MTSHPVLAVQEWPTNAHLIQDVARTGYLSPGWRTLDMTYGLGVFWNLFRPRDLVGIDIDPDKSPCGEPVDFRDTPFPARSFRVVVLDPPYKLNGTPDPSIDGRYGIHIPTRWQARMGLCRDGLTEACRVSDDLVLIKCQDQVCSGKLRSQTFEFTTHALTLGFGLRDRFDMISYRAQPNGTSQKHARHNSSTLLVLKRGWKTSDV